jgi:hypothetical protein
MILGRFIADIFALVLENIPRLFTPIHKKISIFFSVSQTNTIQQKHNIPLIFPGFSQAACLVAK